MNETDLLWLFIQRVPQAIPGAHIERRNIIKGARIGKTDYRISNGVEGQCDSFAVLPGALHVECETKAIEGRLSPAQKRWKARCDQLGIPHLVLRQCAGESADETVAKWVCILRLTHAGRVDEAAMLLAMK